ncbi:hypothetical protein [Burkholderia oklahomensis]|uniref:hypothetical protein n=1 Tax=Burkholderia oklahomensis TaxID=342113 RepID=UPI0026585E73|nr:hypothetical protein [Burkholderia oklahomensis]
MSMPNVNVSETLSSFRPAPADAHVSHRAKRDDERMRSVAAPSIRTTEPAGGATITRCDRIEFRPAGTLRHAIRIDAAHRHSWTASPARKQTRKRLADAGTCADRRATRIACFSERDGSRRTQSGRGPSAHCTKALSSYGMNNSQGGAQARHPRFHRCDCARNDQDCVSIPA